VTRYLDKLILGIFLARGSSKRLKRKVLKKINGKELFLYGLQTALKSNLDRVVLSTEDIKIKKVAEKNNINVPFLRPKYLAKDFSNDFDIIRNVLENTKKYFKENYKFIAVIQATTPFISVKDINTCINTIKKFKKGTVFSSRIINDHPRWAWYLDKNKKVTPVLNRKLQPKEQHKQNLRRVIFPNGGMWLVNVNDFLKQKSVYASPLRTHIMSEVNSIDIDTVMDFEIAKIIAKKFRILKK
jgi:CMP-N-acetylneuraminic acid synthetase